MIILIILIVIFVIGLLMTTSYQLEDIGWPIVIVGLVLLLTFFIVWPANYYSSEAQVEKYYALERTLENSREKEQIEDAALMLKVVENNVMLAEYKYWNDSLFDIFISDKIDSLEELK